MLHDTVDRLLVDRLGGIDDVMLHRTAGALGLATVGEEEAVQIINELVRVIQKRFRSCDKWAFIADHLAPEAAKDWKRKKQLAGGGERTGKSAAAKYSSTTISEAREILEGLQSASDSDKHWASYVREWATENGKWE